MAKFPGRVGGGSWPTFLASSPEPFLCAALAYFGPNPNKDFVITSKGTMSKTIDSRLHSLTKTSLSSSFFFSSSLILDLARLSIPLCTLVQQILFNLISLGTSSLDSHPLHMG